MVFGGEFLYGESQKKKKYDKLNNTDPPTLNFKTRVVVGAIRHLDKPRTVACLTAVKLLERSWRRREMHVAMLGRIRVDRTSP